MIWEFIDILTRRLLAWSAISIVAGILLLERMQRFWQAFAIQAFLWGLASAASALRARRGLRGKLLQHVDLDEARQAAEQTRKTMKPVAGLSLLFAGIGLALAFFLGRNDPFWTGTGWGILVQAGFLLLFSLLHAKPPVEEIFIPDFGVFKGPQHEDFWLEGGSAAAVVVHGFPGTPDEMRTFAEGLHEQGWSVRGLLLPGHGAAMPFLFQYRYQEWSQAIHDAVEELKQRYEPVLLVGYSMGGGLSILAVAEGAKPDAMALMAPFWWYQPPWLRPVIGITRLLLPLSFKPMPRLNLSEAMVRQALQALLPDLDWNSPEMAAQLKDFRAPLVFLDQFRWMGTEVEQCAGLVKIPTLIVQGKRDRVVLPPVTKRLSRMLRGKVELIMVDGEHEINLPGKPGHSQALQAVLTYARQVLARGQ